ncbi:sacsin N-terminal ATP-binding-like domain-containing protein [Nocardia sp. CS682]|uniref:sacsin N-terminal ATP-binding-like domain-containing protein n=1 Tax=Nocardia sp. CS682 TaxID=1047172 RepID=UPI0010754E8D|nr:ATP-binding protein [Nocardia sp. CS682]QBS42805.1 ATP-binding protein [Nocardia sp. CS682]
MLAAWRDSPTRLREDAATEADLVRAGYRDRLLTELAQNAADAAAKAGVAGRLLVRLDGGALHVANAGAPLDVSGVHALTALRASGKSDVAAVGRFGVGFTAVLSVSDEIELRSATGSLRFSRELTWDALREHGIRIPGSSAEDADGFAPPVLRMTWPIEAAPMAGFDTEVVLRLRPAVDAAALLAGMHAEAVDLLLELPALQSITIDTAEFTSTTADLGNGLQEVRVAGPGDTHRVWWQYRAPHARWLLPIRNGRPIPAAPDVLRAPTRSDEELSLPALLIADIPMQPDRRRLLPGARLAELATGYADFARALPPRDRLVLVPTPAFARSEADGLLREALVRDLQTHPWLPVVATRHTAPEVADDAATGLYDPAPHHGSPGTLSPAGTAASSSPAGGTPEAGGFTLFDAPSAESVEVPTADSVDAPLTDSLGGPLNDSLGGPLNDATGGLLTDSPHRQIDVAVPTRASALTGLTEELARLLDDVVGPLVIPELSGRGQAEALGVLDVHRLGLARLAELSSGLERPPHWWYALYAALEPFVVDPLAAEELGALAVPLADGRLVTGPRTAVLDDQLEVAIPVHWARLVHPEAAHPLLARLGARSATAEDLLSEPDLRAELEDHPDDPDITDAVLRLAAHADPAALPSWLGLLELPDAEGESRPADELLLPDAPLRELLVEDSPFSSIDPAMVERYGAQALRAIGVGWDFSVVVEADPTGPDHDLDDEDSWWSTLPEDPPELAAVRDLDLVDEAAWPEALWQLASTPRTRRLLTDREGYTAWWLRANARIDGTPLGLFRHPTDTEFAGLLPTFAVPGLTEDAAAVRAVLADPSVITPELAAALLEALADAEKTPTPEVISRTHARLAAAVAAEYLDLADLELPDRVRALSGAVVDPAQAVVLDQPWFGLALPPNRLVVGDIDTAPALATLLDLPLVSESVTAEVLSAGRRTSWSAEPLGVVLRQLFALPPQAGDLVLHDDLTVRLHGAVEVTASVPWWREGDTVHFRVPR